MQRAQKRDIRGYEVSKGKVEEGYVGIIFIGIDIR